MAEQAARGLAKKLGTLDVWALGVGIVVCGQYFGWNLGLEGNGPVAMLLASLFVCLLFVAWLLALPELSVAMPYADGPLEYGRRAWGPGLGFGMAWSMFLASQFGAIATAIGAGNYIAFLFNPGAPPPALVLWAGLGTVVLFFLLQAWGVKEQARALIVMTFAALGGLMIYWGVAASNFVWERLWPVSDALGAKGWKGVGDAIPYALWWLIIIEGVALSAEECREPSRNIPRGLLAAIVTVVVMVVLTLGLGCGAMSWQELAQKEDNSPLGKVVHVTLGGRLPSLLRGFSVIAVFGLIASYHGLLYAASRQAFALGWAWYLPPSLGRLHAGQKTPVNALLVSSLITAGFVVASLRFREAIEVAILIAGLSSLVWYVLAMFCLLVLRRRSPEMFAGYRAPFGPLLPVAVIVMSLFTLLVYAGIEVKVLPLGAALYAAGFGYYLLVARRRVRVSSQATASGQRKESEQQKPTA
jgi:ethanolamine permease